MRINNQPIPGIHKAYEQHKKSVGTKEPGINKKNDDIKLSAEAILWGVASKALRELPEVKSDKNDLAELKQAINTGAYQVNSEEVAERIWQESAFDKRV